MAETPKRRRLRRRFDDDFKAQAVLLVLAHERLSSSRATYLRTTDGHLWGKPTNGVESKYLLTGLVQCALCGGGIYVASRSHGKRRAFFYACTTFHRKGHTVCANNRQMVMEAADWAVMEVVQDELLDPVVVAEALRQATTILVGTPEETAVRLAALDVRAKDIAASITRWTEAIAAGGELPSLVERLRICEEDRARLQHERQQLDAYVRIGQLDAPHVERELRHRVDEFRS